MSAPTPSAPGGERSLLSVAVLQALVALGGMAALSWEVVWQTQASLAFGISAVGTALTLAATMGGMAVGSLVAGAYLRGRQVAHPLWVYSGLELVIGLSGLVMLPGFQLLTRLDAAAYAAAPALAPALHVAGVLLLLAPPTLAMGATIPVFQLVARCFGTSVSALYGLNTAGAAAGVLLLTFELLPSLGITQTCLLVAGFNAFICLSAFLLRPGLGAAADVPADASPEPGGARLAIPLPLARLAVATTGFVTFGLEVAWFRAMRSAFWSTSATFAIILASVLIPLALGARWVPWLRRRGVSPGTLLAISAIAMLLSTPVVERLDLAVAIPGPYSAVLMTWFMLTLLVVGPAVLFLATTLPWCLEDYPDPATSGSLYAANTLGAVLGSLTTAWVLLPGLGFARSAWVLALAVAALAFLLSRGPVRLVASAASALALLVAMAGTSSPGRDRIYGSPDLAGHTILATDEGPDFTVSVVQNPTGMRELLIDGFAASAENDTGGQYMYWMGSLPVLLHPEPERGLVICFGTGRTANAVRTEGIGSLDIVDVSPAVLAMAPLFPSNQGVLDGENVESIVMDGRAWLRRSDARYDVITLEPMPPNFAGVYALYSREFYEIMATRLQPGGVVAQWLPIHLLTAPHAAAVTASFHAVFPDSIVWIDPYGGTGILLGRLAGSPEPLGTQWPGFARSNAERVLSPEEIRKGVMLDPELTATYAGTGEIVTDDNQLLAYSQTRPGLRGDRAQQLAARNFGVLTEIAGRTPFLVERERLPDPSARRRGGPRRNAPGAR